MRKIIFSVALMVLTSLVYAGGLLTNTNQSAQFIRMMSRNASLGIDAVYFNPAGLTELHNGWHFAAYSQTILQTKPVDSKFPFLNNNLYEGVVNVPVFPTAFAVYKMDKLALSVGFGPNAGGGSAVYETGLPSFEIPISKVVPLGAQLGQIDEAMQISGYDADLSFEGSSVFWGIQLGASYKVNDIFSVYGGVRYLPAKNIYKGTIQNIQLQVGEQYYPASEWLSQSAIVVQDLATNAGVVANSLQPIIDNGAGGFTLDQVQGANFIDEATRTEIEEGIERLGANPEGMNISQIQQTFSGAQKQLEDVSGRLGDTSGRLTDMEVDTEQTGSGFTPMVGVNILAGENFNIALKYEMKTALSLKNSTTVDDLGLFPDGVSVGNDLPALFAAGLGYRNEIVEAQLSYNMYFNKGVNWGQNIRDLAILKDSDTRMIRERKIDRNGMEIALGLQFNASDRFAVSFGAMYGDQGIGESYQSDFSYSNPSVTAGAGFEWKISRALTLDAGFSNTFYSDQQVTFNDPDVGNYNEIYSKTTLNFAAGLSYSIFN